MIDDIVMATGRWLCRLTYSLPLSRWYLDEDFRDDESRHLSWGLGFYLGLLVGFSSLIGGWLGLIR